ncbi:hypothetical protein SAMN04488559_10690 [Isobaculum melis]|uniref:Uncharacterized protein n=1 Tax=Isobaculum melis TaxID=142588 RepID=A0A1H9S4B5_9LACT|nr:hypothetical protein SAMN04488559_10690 [Isobaculum melis]
MVCFFKVVVTNEFRTLLYQSLNVLKLVRIDKISTLQQLKE